MRRSTRLSHSARRNILIVLAAAIVASSCELSSGFLSDTERSSLYSLSINAGDAAAIENGSVVLPGTEISAVVSRKSGAGDLAALDFALESQGGTPAAGLRLNGAASKALPVGASGSDAVSASKTVASIDGKLGGFSIPEGLAPGFYTLSASLSGGDGSVLQKESVYIFVGDSQPVIESVSTFPPSVEPGTGVLLGLRVSMHPVAAGAKPAAAAGSASAKGAATAAGDPWIRWSKDGSSFSEGLLSGGFDKAVWPAPRTEGAYSISVEVFPSAPLTGKTFPFKARVSQELKVMVIAPPGGSGNDFADPLSFYSLLRLDGNFDDIGTRPRASQPEGFGSPALDTYSTGFGYRLGPSSGVRIPGLMPPTAGGAMAAFSTIVRLDSDQAEGVLVRFASDDGSYYLVLGVKDSQPYVEYQAEGKTLRSTAQSAAFRFPMTLEAYLKPDGDKLKITWWAEGERIEAPSLPLTPPPPPGGAQLGGAQSLPGVYDGFALRIGSPSPSYRLASRRKYKAALVIAEAFEDQALPPKSLPAGSVSAASGALALEPGSALSLSPAFDLSQPLLVEADAQGEASSLSAAVSTEAGDRLLGFAWSGEVSGPGGEILGRAGPAGLRLAFSLELKDGRVYLRGPEASFSVAAPAGAKRFLLSLERKAGGAGTAAVDRILARSSSAPAARK
jgi:hypothetical protein